MPGQEQNNQFTSLFLKSPHLYNLLTQSLLVKDRSRTKPTRSSQSRAVHTAWEWLLERKVRIQNHFIHKYGKLQLILYHSTISFQQRIKFYRTITYIFYHFHNAFWEAVQSRRLSDKGRKGLYILLIQSVCVCLRHVPYSAPLLTRKHTFRNTNQCFIKVSLSIILSTYLIVL